MTKLLTLACMFGLLLSWQAMAQDACKAEWDEAKQGAEKQVESMRTAGERMRSGVEESKEEYDACLEGTLRWEKQHWAFDLPEVRMTDKRMSLDLPETRMKDQRWSWDHPTTVCETRCDGPRIPTLVCSGLNCKFEDRPSCYPSCRVENRRQEVVVGVPEIKMSRREFVMGIPTVTMKRVDWYFDGPSFYPTQLCIGRETCSQQCGSQLEKAGKKHQTQFQAVSSNAQRAMMEQYRPAYSCTITNLKAQRQLAIAQIDGAVTAIKSILATEAISKNAKMVADYSKQLEELIQKRAETDAAFETAIKDMELKMAGLTAST